LFTLHATWLVNSAAHLYGSHPYDEHSNPAESPLVSASALGEGWHNYHHAFPNDYSTSEFGAGTQYNPTRILIDTCATIGLVWDRNAATRLCEMRLKDKETKIVGPPMFRRRLSPKVIDAHMN
jgi:stearoyl-CoA desaturase (delta-9 desaturase)